MKLIIDAFYSFFCYVFMCFVGCVKYVYFFLKLHKIRKIIYIIKSFSNRSIKIEFVSFNMCDQFRKKVIGDEKTYVVLFDDSLYTLSSSFTGRFKQHLNKDINFVYFDHTEGDLGDLKYFCKPSWSPRLYEDFDYMGNCFAVRSDVLFDKLNAFTGDYSNLKNHLLDSLSNQAHHIQHQPFFAFHQMMPIDFKQKEIQQKINDLSHLRASIIIPTKDGIDLLKTCIDSILNSKNTIQVEIIIVNNNSKNEESFLYFDELSKILNVRTLNYASAFNWSKINNFSALHATGDILVFLNNDVEVITKNWLDQLCTEAIKKDVGMVGAQLLFPNNSIQHAGMVLGMCGFVSHVRRLEISIYDNFPFISPNYNREVMALTGACHVIEKKKFNQINGYDEEYIVCCSDVDLCLRLNRSFLKTIYMGSVKLYHYESMTRDAKKHHHNDNYKLLKYIWFYIFNCEPYYNESLNLKNTTPTLHTNFH